MPRDAIKIHLVETLEMEKRCLVFSVRVLCRSRKFRVIRRSSDLATYQRNSNGSRRRSVSLDTRLVGYATVSDSLLLLLQPRTNVCFVNNNRFFARSEPFRTKDAPTTTLRRSLFRRDDFRASFRRSSIVRPDLRRLTSRYPQLSKRSSTKISKTLTIRY